MNDKTDWNPTLYLKFKNERTRPSVDMASRIPLDAPAAIIDIGCGPGNSTQILHQRWPGSRISGMDNSPAMIAQARKDFPSQDWVLGDAMTYDPGMKFDLVFSNATIQWIPDHEILIPRLFGMVERGGVLAVQIPRFREIALGRLLDEVSNRPRWRNLTAGCGNLFTYHDSGFYYDLLEAESSSIDVWETDYMHILDSREAVLEWSRGTGIRPYLDALASETLKKEFESDLLDEISAAYPSQKNGKVIFLFKRLFVIACKK